MKKSDEFKIGRMLEEMPLQKTGSIMNTKFDHLKERYRTPNKSISRVKWIIYYAAASISIFLLAFLLASYLQQKRIEQLQISNAYMRSLLIQTLPANQAVDNQLKVFDYLINNENATYTADELIEIYENTDDINLKLASLELFDKFRSQDRVLLFLSEQLQVEESPLLLIPLINFISKEKSRKGIEVLMNLKKDQNIHKAVRDHLNDLES